MNLATVYSLIIIKGVVNVESYMIVLKHSSLVTQDARF